MRLDLFDYELPQHFIATRPAEPRDSARLLDLSGEGIVDRSIADFPDLLRPGDILVYNDTRVIPARLVGRRGAARIEATLHKAEADGSWAAFVRPAKRCRVGDTVLFEGELEAEVIEKRDGGETVFRFPETGAALIETLKRVGSMPLPPYIKRDEAESVDDDTSYQTMFASRDGAVAAPTAGLHFTDRLIERIDAAGVERCALTLHVGAGTFMPVKVEDTDDHKMHFEWGEISAEVAERINRARAAGGRVVAVGTTSLRLLESAAREDGTLSPFSGETGLFITPGYRFKIVDLLLTNFHLPKSTLLMLVSALVGRERILAAYEHAKAEGYRFFSYGDACLLKRTDLAP
ncbi:MAG: tRNA preQ1(34) S-adenosylmethionine ribosyltransferase-isomerase QueA [Nisaea sp.]|uniref:tRNA preQ1(34) S-adenosylmethionine ribosyltransferase-isomerase QueA n=1 Tax=Nisaea sp. TaxID=2024842 RepID=UPI001B083514|nr:tRNA preQ1(34) S-adenosylmethionine ribosyltransferase-isomerase QueA [Nisaea sp.]MBO6559407.1 tRNA preQ1(34) S-adenosylmethionine ribosyltransferase-isomerase QueA [Nisaea sp.]